MIAVLTADGTARQVADGIAFPNGMAVTPDDSTLIVAESYGRKLTAFDIARDGGLSNRCLWADSRTITAIRHVAPARSYLSPGPFASDRWCSRPRAIPGSR